MLLGVEELFDVIDEITDRIRKEIMLANRTGELETVLSKYNYSFEEDLIDEEGKILIIGESQVSKCIIEEVANECNVDVSRLEMVLGYEKAKRFNIDKLKNNTNYSFVLVGPMPHNTRGVSGHTSTISRLENPSEGFPMTRRLMNASNSLCINKESLRNALSTI